MPIIDTRGVFIGFTQKGNIFLCDYKSLDGIKANTINRKQQYLMAPLVLLHRTPDDKLMPIAIQVRRPQYSSVRCKQRNTFLHQADLELWLIQGNLNLDSFNIYEGRLTQRTEPTPLSLSRSSSRSQRGTIPSLCPATPSTTG